MSSLSLHPQHLAECLVHRRPPQTFAGQRVRQGSELLAVLLYVPVGPRLQPAPESSGVGVRGEGELVKTGLGPLRRVHVGSENVHS